MNMKDSFPTNSSFKKLNKSFTCIMGRSARRVFQHKIFCELRVERCEGETRARLCMSRGERSAGKLAGSAVSVCIFVNTCILSYFCTYLYIFVFLFIDIVYRFYRTSNIFLVILVSPREVMASTWLDPYLSRVLLYLYYLVFVYFVFVSFYICVFLYLCICHLRKVPASTWLAPCLPPAKMFRIFLELAATPAQRMSSPRITGQFCSQRFEVGSENREEG